ncbi:MAG: acyl-CoA dehydrogenase family protein [Sterolibacterium sp.]|nr:acyl-CoA dehydrogenase family protein [Sterolibacterium sp.]
MSLFDDWRAQSPYYNASHEEWAQTVRRFVDKEITPYIETWEAAGEVPREVHLKAAAVGLLQQGFPEEYGGISEGVDMFHGLVATDELAKTGASGLQPALMMHTVALTPIIKLGTAEMKQRIAPEVLAGKKLMSICITEPSGGSDVSAIQTRAEKKSDHWRLNGSKMFISGGMRSDYYTVVARAGGPGPDGLALFLVEKGRPGFTQTKLDKMGWHMSDTAALYFDDVDIPLENIIGPEDNGFMAVVHNLNAERIGMAAGMLAFARCAIDEAHEWAQQRVTFGKPLIKNQVIRHKFAEMVRHVSASQAFVDQLVWAYQHDKLDFALTALCKVQASRTLDFCARECAQILGGASFIKGVKIERIYRDVRAHVVGGGSEEILLDFAARQLGYA